MFQWLPVYFLERVVLPKSPLPRRRFTTEVPDMQLNGCVLQWCTNCVTPDIRSCFHCFVINDCLLHVQFSERSLNFHFLFSRTFCVSLFSCPFLQTVAISRLYVWIDARRLRNLTRPAARNTCSIRKRIHVIFLRWKQRRHLIECTPLRRPICLRKWFLFFVFKFPLLVFDRIFAIVSPDVPTANWRNLCKLYQCIHVVKNPFAHLKRFVFRASASDWVIESPVWTWQCCCYFVQMVMCIFHEIAFGFDYVSGRKDKI